MTVHTTVAAPGKRRIVESGKTLSQCLIWKMLEDYYEHAGQSAWDTIPYHPTSNPFVGEVYADILISFLNDYLPRLKKNEPLYIIELGAGSGLFSCHVLSEFQRKRSYFHQLRRLELCYVMTDFTGANVSSWEERTELEPFVEAGLLDFAVYRPDIDSSLRLRLRGTELSPATVRNPVVAIANYFFDSLRHDFFHVDGEELKEARLTFFTEQEISAPLTLGDLTKEDSFESVSAAYYTDDLLNQVLLSYGRELGEASVLFPIGAFDCIRNLRRLSHDQLMLLSTDLGFKEIDHMRGHAGVPYDPHDRVVYYMVNYHAIGRYFEELGGSAFSTPENHVLNSTVCLLLPKKAEPLEQTTHYLNEILLKKNPVSNLYALQGPAHLVSAGENASATFKSCIAFVQLTNCDSAFFAHCGVVLSQIIDHLDAAERGVLREVLGRVHGNLYPASFAKRTVLSLLYRLYYGLGLFDECLRASEEFLSTYGPDSYACYYIAVCNEIHRDYHTALKNYQHSFELLPEFVLARQGIARVTEKIAAASGT